jgi:hypothetical protein
MDSVARTAIEDAVGSSPWDWKTFPAVGGMRSPSLAWYCDEGDGPGRAYVALHEIGASAYKLLLGSGCHPFGIAPGQLGLWFADSDSIRIICFDPDNLPDIPRPAHFTKLQMRYHAGIEPLESLLIAPNLSPGLHDIGVSGCVKAVDELLAVAPYGPNRTTTIFSLRLSTGELTVYPQLWFDDMFQGGWESITKVTRHPQRGSIIGGGSRIRPFELTEDGCQLAQWL